jgi:hypothetical protein
MAGKSLNVIASGIKSAALSVAALVRQSFEVVRPEGSNNLYFRFRGSEGKGTGAQLCRPSDLDALLSVMQEYLDNGPPSEEEGAVPAETMFRRTFEVHDDGAVSFRLSNGKGAKPVKLANINLLGELVDTLREEAANRADIIIEHSDDDSEDAAAAQGWKAAS